MEIEHRELRDADAQLLLARFRQGETLFAVTRPGEEVLVRKSGRGPHGNSLRQICGKMLKCFHDKSSQDIYLNEFSLEQKVERRRIYDVVNILEAFDIVTKRAKNVYQWNGLACFIVRLKLLEVAEKSGLGALHIFPFEKNPILTKKKLLTFLALRVLRLFSAGKEVLSFPEILELCGPEHTGPEVFADDGDAKNRVRRLYDIVNVFRSLGLIIKCPRISGKKLYLWKGEAGFSHQLALLRPLDAENVRPRAEEPKPLPNSAFKICRDFPGQDPREIRAFFGPQPSLNGAPRK